MSRYKTKDYSNRREYLDWLAERYGVDRADVVLLASILGTDQDFDGLPSTLADLPAAKHTFHQRDRGPCDQCGLCAAGQPLPGTEELPGPRPGTGGRSAKKSRPPRSARTLLTTAREWLDSQADEEYGYEDDGDY